MSSANTTLRSVLCSPTANTIWEKSLREAKAPLCPHDMTHIQYATLISGAGCSVCHSPFDHRGFDFEFGLTAMNTVLQQTRVSTPSE
jgi:hypothetical protein